MDTHTAIQAFIGVLDTPFLLSTAPGEPDYSCAGKHAILKFRLESLGYSTRYRVGAFNWSTLRLSLEVFTIPHKNESIYSFLEVFINNDWLPIEATWDKAIGRVLPCNDWNGTSATPISVRVTSLFTPDESLRIMTQNSTQKPMGDISLNSRFYSGINAWLDQVRH